MTPELKSRIETLVQENSILLFMKGNKFFPQCGFSARAVGILQELQIPFHTVDVLQDQDIRQGIKEYGNWPTIPQLYIDGEFVGGADIMMEMHNAGEIAELLTPE